MEKKLQWHSVSPLKDVGSIDEFERKVGFKFPQSFRDCVIANNAGRPNWDAFDTDKDVARDFQGLFSFNHEDHYNIFDRYEWNDENFEELGKKYVPFASSNFGDPIAFDPETGYVIFVDHETLDIELIAKTFDEFLEKLYDFDEREADYLNSTEGFSAPSAPQPVQQDTPKKRGFRFPFFRKRNQ